MHLIIGDAVISNPQAWHLADIDLSFPGEVAIDAKPNVDGLQTHIVEGVKPEIKHTFRQPEKRPPAIISNAFTVLCLVPILIMIGCWMKVIINIHHRYLGEGGRCQSTINCLTYDDFFLL